MPILRSYEWKKLFLIFLVIVAFPTIVYYGLRWMGWDLFPLHMTVATFYLITAVMIAVEATIAMFRRFAAPPGQQAAGWFDRWSQRTKKALGVLGAQLPGTILPVPRSTLIVSAYLPNEKEIIEESLRHILDTVHRPADGLEVILVYNTPVPLPIEDRLRQLTGVYPELKLLHLKNSESKAENLNAAVDVATGKVIGILDADHHPDADCLERAWRWLEKDYDVVQGRSVIRNAETNFQTRMIAVEFECIYAVSHPARSLLVDTGIFGGSNGYWRTEVIRKVRFNPEMMTEDIDSTARALLGGYRILHDRSIKSSELAPADFRSFWFQRQRWAQGWLQVAMKYQTAFWKTRHLGFWQKFYWTYLLFYRELCPLLTLQIFPILFSLVLYERSLPLFNHWYLWLSAILTLVSGPYQVLSASRNALVRYPGSYRVVYSLGVFFFVILKNAISVMAVYNQWRGYDKWVVTRRETTRKIQQHDIAIEDSL